VPYVDYERAWAHLRRHVATKGSHGQRELLAQMGLLEVECAVPEGQETYDPAPLPRRRRAAVMTGNGSTAD
jgi:hypothetical protein